MNIYLQSFFSEPLGYPFSVCRWQPNGYKYYTLDFFKPVDQYGTELKGMEPEVFLECYCGILKRNYSLIYKWFEGSIKSGRDLTLCCWCNLERQKRTKLYCHTILIGYFLDTIKGDKDVTLHYLDGRELPVWSYQDFKDCFKRVLHT